MEMVLSVFSVRYVFLWLGQGRTYCGECFVVQKSLRRMAEIRCVVVDWTNFCKAGRFVFF